MSLSPTCTIGGNPTPATVTPGTVNGALANPAGVVVFLIKATTADDTTGQAGVASVNASLSVNATNKTFSYTHPNTSGGSAVIFMVTVGISTQTVLGVGRDADGVVHPEWTATFKVNVPTTDGIPLMAVSEVGEQGASGWLPTINGSAKKVTSGGGGNQGQTNLTLVNGVNHDVVTDGKSLQVISGPTAAFSISGFSLTPSLKAGNAMDVVNQTIYPCSLLIEDTSSTAANRLCGNRGGSPTTVLAPIYIPPNGGEFRVTYDATANRMRVMVAGYGRQKEADARDFKGDNNGFGTGVFSWQAITDTIEAAGASAISGAAQGAASLPVRLAPGFFYHEKPIVLDDPNVSDFGGYPYGNMRATGTLVGQLWRTTLQAYYVGDQIVAVGQFTPPTYVHYTTGGDDRYLMTLSEGSQFPYVDISDTFCGDVNGATALRLEAFVNVPLGDGAVWSCIGSQGARGNEGVVHAFWLTLNPSLVTGSAVGVQFMTTTTNGTVTLTASAALTAGGHTVWGTYDGAFMRIYVDGHFITKAAQTGTIVQKPWETALLGALSNSWPDSAHGVNGGPYSIGDVRIAATLVAGNNAACALYTNEVTPYTPVTSDAAFVLNTYTYWLQTFTPANTTAFAHGQFCIGATMKTFAGSVPGWPVYSLIKGQSAQTHPVRIHDLGLTGYAGGVRAYLKPDTRIERVAFSGGTRGITLDNNCYSSVVSDCELLVNTTQVSAHSWCVASISASGNGAVRDCITSGGTYGYVQNGGSNELSNLYHVATGLGASYCNNSGGLAGLNMYSEVNCDWSDEAGSVTDATVFISNTQTVSILGAQPHQSTTFAVPVLKLDGCANVDASALWWGGSIASGTQTIKVLSSGTSQFPALPIVIRNYQQVQGVGAADTPWTDTACPVTIMFPQLAQAGKSFDFASDADMVFGAGTPADFNDFFYRTLTFTDSGNHLTVGRNVKLSLVTAGYERVIVNKTNSPGAGQILTIEGPSGTGVAVGIGKTAILRSDGTNWVRITPDT